MDTKEQTLKCLFASKLLYSSFYWNWAKQAKHFENNNTTEIVIYFYSLLILCLII